MQHTKKGDTTMLGNSEKLTYSRKEVKSILGISDLTLQQLYMRETNLLPSLRIGKKIYIPCELFKQWLLDEAARNAGWKASDHSFRHT